MIHIEITTNCRGLPYFLSKIPLQLWSMIDIKKYSLGQLEVIYDNMDEETQKWMLDNLYLWFEKET